MLERIWNYFMPFAVLTDVSRGSLAEKAAAYRYNCEMRSCLPTYISRWIWSFTAALVLVGVFDAVTPYEGAAALNVFVLIAAGFALFAAMAVCAIFLLSYAYASLAFAASRTRAGGSG
jgi:hypothetical protein